jgi:hypothetical protein
MPISTQITSTLAPKNEGGAKEHVVHRDGAEKAAFLGLQALTGRALARRWGTLLVEWFGNHNKEG